MNSRELILEQLATGKKTRAELCWALNITDKALRENIRELRKQGVPICSSSQSKGYWLGTREELNNTIKEYRSRYVDIVETLHGLTRAYLGCDIKNSVFKDVCTGCAERERCYR